MAKAGRQVVRNEYADDLPPRRRRRWPLILGLLLIVVVTGLALAPTIISNTGALHWLVNNSAPIKGEVRIGSASLGWLSPLAAGEVEVYDPEGKLICKVGSVATSKTLAELLLDRSNLGVVKVSEPCVYIVGRADGSNLTDTLAPLLKKSDPKPGGAKQSIECEVIQGLVVVRDERLDREYQLSNLNARLALDGDAAQCAMTGRATGGDQPADLKLDLASHRDAAAAGRMVIDKLDCQIRGLPLAMLQPFVARAAADARLSGVLSADIKCTQQTDGGLAITGDITAEQFALAAAALGQDQLHLANVQIPIRLIRNGTRMRVEQLSLNCELGQVALEGEFNLADFTAGQAQQALLKQPCVVRGQVDLARVAQMLPSTLRIRSGTQITSGTVQCQIASQAGTSGQNWTGTLTSTPILARANGNTIGWRDPVSVEVAAHQGASGPIVDRLMCQSSFLKIEGAGTPEQLTATASFDLGQLVGELDQFVDLGDLRLGGQGAAQLQWQQSPSGQFALRGQLRANQFQLAMPSHRPWRENELVIDLDSAGTLAAGELKQMSTLRITGKAGAEQLAVQLMQPVTDYKQEALPLSLNWQGQLAAWMPRLEPWFDLSSWDVSGPAAVEANLRWGTDRCEVQPLRLRAQDLHMWGKGLFVDEQQFDLQAAARWDSKASQLEIPQAQVNAGQIALQVTGGRWSAPTGAAAAAGGNLSLTAELAQLNRWRQDPRRPATQGLSGRLTLQAELANSAGRTTAQSRGQIENFVMIDQPTTAPAEVGAFGDAHFDGARRQQPQAAEWREPKIDLTLQGVYDEASGQVQLQQAAVSSNALRCEVAGAARDLANRCEIDLNGKLDYDLAQLAPIYRKYLGSNAEIVGRQSRAFRLQGPLAGSKSWTQLAAGMTGVGSLGWDRAQILGLQIGQGVLTAHVGNNMITTDPLDLAVSEGRLTLAPQIRLVSPAELLIAPGPLATNMRLSPELCAQGLKFIAPVLAEATVAEGKFSITMDGAKIPLPHPLGSDATGKLVVHSAEVRPGPLAEQFILLGKQISAILSQRRPPSELGTTQALLTLTDQNISFRLVEGRVYHQGLEFNAGTVLVRTHGSVGLDETVSIMAEIPIRDEWVAREPILAGLRGQTLEIPIQGTLARPQIDRKAIDKLGGKLFENAARGAVIDQLNKLLPLGK